MKTKFILFFFGLINISFAFCQTTSRKDWIEDINYLKTELPKKWIFLIMLTPFPEAGSCDVFRMTFRRMLTPLS
ncbi:hypothetical protein, partial [Plebeiibacterium sediminum]